MSVARPVWRYFTLSLLTLGLLHLSAFGSSRSDDAKQIEVRLIPKKKTTRAGETLEVRVEIWNVGSQPLFIRKTIFDICGYSPLSLRLELGPPVKPQPGYGCAADCVYRVDDSFARRLVLFWTILPPGDFYGTVVSMDPDTFPQLKTPGRWRLRGRYRSSADVSSPFCFDPKPLPDNKEQVKLLPFVAWQGEVDTNTNWIEVAPG